ncbi:hypothetical protein [Marinilabilia rubra]|uniref:Uncharacterized protein n=1 Tax=Marinilabilia rubra TaxID=2162893 RepID=A0A2U2B3C7_9BACT|nr:hypothetical protein [Marinilabilia rubra]PWD97554.1 hypothetical protein DDZ16_20110 [Marinilabilia rubra]
MNRIEIRQNFHNLIDSIENENILFSFYELLKSRSQSEQGSLWNKLTFQEQEDLIKLADAANDPSNLIDHNEIKKKHTKWL